MSVVTVVKLVRGELVTLRELEESGAGRPADFPYVDDFEDPRFVVLEGDVFDCGDVMAISADDAAGAGFDFYIDATFDSRWVGRFLSGDDDGFVLFCWQYVTGDLEEVAR